MPTHIFVLPDESPFNKLIENFRSTHINPDIYSTLSDVSKFFPEDENPEDEIPFIFIDYELAEQNSFHLVHLINTYRNRSSVTLIVGLIQNHLLAPNLVNKEFDFILELSSLSNGIPTIIENLIRAYQIKNNLYQIKKSLRHDVRSPVGVIQTGAELLQSGMCGAINEEQKQIIERILRSTGKFFKLVDHLSDEASFHES